jgi:hypothetical protein
MTKYEPLYKSLLDIPGKSASLRFQEIEIIIRESLPDSAYKSRSWWGNKTAHSVQARSWVDAGWKVVSVDLENKIVRFRKKEPPAPP